MDFSKIVLILILSLFQFSTETFAGKVIFLRGSRCAGKTSLCSELVKLDNSWKCVEEDEVYYRDAVIYWQKLFPAEFAEIVHTIDSQNILHAILRNQILFKVTASDEERLKARNAIALIQDTLNSRDKKQEIKSKTNWSATLRDQITQTIISLAQQNNVIVDTWFLKPEHIQQIADSHAVIHVVAYSSFSEVVKRTMKRNYKALMDGNDISNLRFFHQALKSFTGTYDISDKPEGSIAIIDKQSVVHALDLVEMQLKNSPDATGSLKVFTRGEFSLQEFQQYREDLLGKFKSDNGYIVPYSLFDLVVITDACESIEPAKQIINWVKNYENH